MAGIQYRCPVCGCTDYDEEKVSLTGSGLSKLMDLQYKTYTACICANCGNVMLFKSKGSLLWNALDLFGGR